MNFGASRHHDFSAGHRVVGHEGKCRNLHGHNYRVHFHCEPEEGLDGVGRVVDFSVIKERLCAYLEEAWDHRFLVNMLDPLRDALATIDPTVAIVPFNPTAENMAAYLLDVVGPERLKGSGVRLAMVVVEETRKCSAAATL